MSEVLSMSLRLESHASAIEEKLAREELEPACAQIQAQRALDLRVAAKLLRNFAVATSPQSDLARKARAENATQAN